MSHTVRRLSLFFFLLWPIVASWLSFKFSVNALLSTIIFYGIPALLLSIYRPKRIKKVFFVSLVPLPFLTIVDYVAERTGTWLWPLPHSYFSFRFFDYVSVEILIWGFLYGYAVIMFYQYFFEKIAIKKFWDKRSEEALVGTGVFFALFLIALFLYPSILNIPYWYLVFGTLGILPIVIIEDIKYPLVFPKLLKTAGYFFYLNFIYEVTALKLGWWSFPSKQFIGYMSFFGVTFPFEEFFFWIILFTLAMLSYYEYFFNKER